MRELFENELHHLLPGLRQRVISGGVIYRDQELAGAVMDKQTEEQVLRRHLKGEEKEAYIVRDTVTGKRDVKGAASLMKKRIYEE